MYEPQGSATDASEVAVMVTATNRSSEDLLDVLLEVTTKDGITVAEEVRRIS